MSLFFDVFISYNNANSSSETIFSDIAYKSTSLVFWNVAIFCLTVQVTSENYKQIHFPRKLHHFRIVVYCKFRNLDEHFLRLLRLRESRVVVAAGVTYLLAPYILMLATSDSIL